MNVNKEVAIVSIDIKRNFSCSIFTFDSKNSIYNAFCKFFKFFSSLDFINIKTWWAQGIHFLLPTTKFVEISLNSIFTFVYLKFIFTGWKFRFRFRFQSKFPFKENQNFDSFFKPKTTFDIIKISKIKLIQYKYNLVD